MTDSPQPKQTLVAAVTLDELGARALDYALDMARTSDAIELHVVYAIEPNADVITGLPLSERPEDAMPRLGAFVRAAVERANAAEGVRPAQVFAHVLLGPASTSIVDFAARLDAEQIVIATHGRRGVKRLFLGSVAEEVVRMAGCPVMVVRPKQHKELEREPQIEPVCPDCAAVRYETKNPAVWCARHTEHHPRAHVYSYEPLSTDPARPWGFHG